MKTKADIDYHSDGYRDSKPAVNVKVYDSLTSGHRKFLKYNPDTDPEFTEEWIEEHVSEDAMNDYWEFALEQGWEMLQTDAETIFGYGTKVYSEGRSGGWAVVDGITAQSVEEWDAIEFNKWKRFAKYARQQADDIMYLVIDGIYYNEFEEWKDERSELRAPDIEAALKGR